MKLFVYGTLRHGAPMHGLIDGDALRLGPARVHARLLDLGNFPGLVHAVTADDWVRGELYRIEAQAASALFARLDRYEGDAFERAEDAVLDASGVSMRAWLYRYRGATRTGHHVASGDWLAYVSGRT